MNSYVGIDGTVHLTDQGLTFERTKLRTAGRGVPPVHQVPWSAVAGATVDRAALRVQVAGYDAPRLNTADPHAVAVKRGQQPLASAIAAQIAQRGAGPAAQPVFSAATPPQAAARAAAPQPVQRVVVPQQAPSASRLYRLMEFGLWLQLVLLVVPLVLIVGIVIWFLVEL